MKKKSQSPHAHYGHPVAHGIALKKQYGQHFLRDQSVIDAMIKAVDLTGASVFEIGCGDGFLTKSLLKTDLARLWIFEIDPQWAEYVQTHFPDNRMTVHLENILDIDFSRFESDKPWHLMANLPYQITFPIIYKLVKHREYLGDGVIMVQEEVAQKITLTSGRGYGFNSLYLQYYFEWKLLTKISPGAFFPPPAVYSRLLYFKPKAHVEPIPHEVEFWVFIKRCFSQPRRNLKNNLKSFHYTLDSLSEETLNLRGQQMSMQDLLDVWSKIHNL